MRWSNLYIYKIYNYTIKLMCIACGRLIATYIMLYIFNTYIRYTLWLLTCLDVYDRIVVATHTRRYTIQPITIKLL